MAIINCGFVPHQKKKNKATADFAAGVSLQVI